MAPRCRPVIDSLGPVSLLDGLSNPRRAELASSFLGPRSKLLGPDGLQPPGHAIAILLILRPHTNGLKAVTEAALLIQWDTHQLHCHHKPEVMIQVTIVEDEGLAMDQCEDSHGHGIAEFPIDALNKQAPA